MEEYQKNDKEAERKRVMWKIIVASLIIDVVLLVEHEPLVLLLLPNVHHCSTKDDLFSLNLDQLHSRLDDDPVTSTTVFLVVALKMSYYYLFTVFFYSLSRYQYDVMFPSFSLQSVYIYLHWSSTVQWSHTNVWRDQWALKRAETMNW